MRTQKKKKKNSVRENARVLRRSPTTRLVEWLVFVLVCREEGKEEGKLVCVVSGSTETQSRSEIERLVGWKRLVGFLEQARRDGE